MKNEVSVIMEYLKSTNLKGNVEIKSDNEFLWDLGGIFLRFLIDNNETVVSYSRCKSHYFEIGHFHEDSCDIVSLIKDINSGDKQIHVVVFLGGSKFAVENKTKNKKKSWLFVRHYYSEL